MNPPILIVDDDSDACEALRLRLLHAGFEAVTAGSGREAIGRYEKLKPRMVFLDASMPGVSGFEVCQQIRALDPERQTRIVFVSGASSPSAEYVERCATFADGDAFLRKPYDFRELLSIITHSNIPHSSYSECEA